MLFASCMKSNEANEACLTCERGLYSWNDGCHLQTLHRAATFAHCVKLRASSSGSREPLASIYNYTVTI